MIISVFKMLTIFIKKYIKIILFFLIILGIFLIANFIIIPKCNRALVQSDKIIRISAENEKIYGRSDKIKAKDFEVAGYDSKDRKRILDEDEYAISTSEPEIIGKTTTVTVTLNTNKKIFCNIDVKNKRKEVASVECGNPLLSDVRAVLYSNGELCFEGKGNILEYKNGEYPWLELSDSGKTSIRSISFEKNVTPVSLDNYFEGLETLEYVDSIPNSVKSMSATFKDCIALTQAPDVSKCYDLTNMTETYSGCEEMTSIPPIPSSVKNTSKMCYGCSELQEGADLSNATGLVVSEEMYKYCYKLLNANIGPNTQDISEMFESCINMTEMPIIPDSVEVMIGTFRNDVSLTNLHKIPSKVKSMNYCFQGCKKITGILVIEGSPEQYSSVLKDAALTTPLDIQGNSEILRKMAETCNGTNVSVNGEN